MLMVIQWRSKSHQITILVSPNPFSEYRNCNKEPGLFLELIEEFQHCLDPSVNDESILATLKLRYSYLVKASQPYLLAIHRTTPEKVMWRASKNELIKLNYVDHCAVTWLRYSLSKETFLSLGIGDNDVCFKTHSVFSGHCIMRF